MHRFLATAVLPPMMAAAALPAFAQEQADPYAPCVAMTDDAQRLACFDTTYGEQRVARAEAAERREALTEERFGMRTQDQDIQRDDVTITGTVAEVLQGARRSQVLLLDNGQLWREVSGSTMRNRVREGWTVSISRHWSGAYEMRFDGRGGYLRVDRLQ